MCINQIHIMPNKIHHNKKSIPEHNLKRLEYIGLFLKNIRINDGDTQVELSETTGIPRNTIQKVEHGNNMTLLTLFRFIDSQEMSLEEFFTEME